MKGGHCFIGAAVGFVAFLLLALYPALLYGGVAGHEFARAALHTSDAEFITKALVMVGMTVGSVIGGILFTAAGAALGSLVGLASREGQRE